MPRVRDPNRDKAFQIYKENKGNIDLVEIASQLNVPDGTVRGWKSKDKWEQKLNGTLQKNTERSNQRNRTSKKVIDDGTRETMLNENLTHEQRLFCVYYSKIFNATQAYINAYKCDWETANTCGPRLLVNVGVKAEIQRLQEIKRQQIVAGTDDLVELHMRIAFADMGNYMKFGQEEVPVMNMFGPVEVKDENTGEKIAVTKIVNVVKANESVNVDTQIIQEVKQGKDGFSIKLADKQKSMDWLDKHFLYNPMDRHKIDYERKKTELLQSQIDNMEKENNNDGGVVIVDDVPEQD